MGQTSYQDSRSSCYIPFLQDHKENSAVEYGAFVPLAPRQHSRFCLQSSMSCVRMQSVQAIGTSLDDNHRGGSGGSKQIGRLSRQHSRSTERDSTERCIHAELSALLGVPWIKIFRGRLVPVSTCHALNIPARERSTRGAREASAFKRTAVLGFSWFFQEQR